MTLSHPTITSGDYSYARELLSLYRAWSAQYVQKNGWTVIPDDAPNRPEFMGEPITTERVNAASSIVERYELWRDKPVAFSGYVTGDAKTVTVWTGEPIANVIDRTAYNGSGFGRSRYRTVYVRAPWGGTYFGREYDTHDVVRLRRMKDAT